MTLSPDDPDTRKHADPVLDNRRRARWFRVGIAGLSGGMSAAIAAILWPITVVPMTMFISCTTFTAGVAAWWYGRRGR